MDSKWKDIEIYDYDPNEGFKVTFITRAARNLKILGNYIYFDNIDAVGRLKHYKFKLDEVMRKIIIS